MRSRPIVLGLLAVCLVVQTGSAGAEIYRCVGSDGEVRFTGDASQCPGATKHEPKARIQSVAPSPRSSAPRPPARPAATDGADAARWLGKKRQAEQQLQHVEARLPAMRKAAGWCNRGMGLYTSDDLGRRRTVKCTDVQEEYARLEQSQAELTRYLAEGLEEECRRAGCLPGWIR